MSKEEDICTMKIMNVNIVQEETIKNVICNNKYTDNTNKSTEYRSIRKNVCLTSTHSFSLSHLIFIYISP